jgi:hypothetical protein
MKVQAAELTHLKLDKERSERVCLCMFQYQDCSCQKVRLRLTGVTERIENCAQEDEEYGRKLQQLQTELSENEQQQRAFRIMEDDYNAMLREYEMKQSQLSELEQAVNLLEGF